jgi:sodium-coupled neutral amino acid transporter 10
LFTLNPKPLTLNPHRFFLGQTGAKAIKFGYGLVILASVPTILLPLQKSAKDLYVTLVPSAAIQVGGPTPGKPPRSSSKPSRSSSLDEDGVSIDATLERGVVTDVAPEVAARLAQGVALCAMLVALTLSLYVPNVAFAFGLTGSTCSFLVAFILPGLAYLSVTGSGPRGGVKRGLHKRGTNTKADIDVELVPIDEPEVKEGGRSFVSAGGLSKASKSGSSLGNGWEWLQESEDDELSDDPTVSLTGTHPDSTKEKHNGHHASKETAEPVKTYFSGTRSERLATKRRRAFAKAQIVVALILMYFCTREVVRELWHERKIVEVVSKITDAKLEAAKLEKDVETIESAKEEYASAQKQFRGALTNATAALSDAERSTAGKSVDHDELEKMNQTIAEKAKQLDNTKAPPIDSNAPPAPPEPTKRKAPAPKQKPTPTPKPLPATPSTEPSSDDSIDATHKAEESLKKVEEVELKSEEAKGKLEDALGMVDEKRKRKEERERSEENDWLEGWVHEHEGEDAGILANVDKVDGKDGKDDKDDNDDKVDKDDKDDNKKKNEKNGANVVKKGDEAKVSTEDFVHGDDVANDYDDKDKGSQGKNDTYIPDPSDVVARAEEKVKELSEQREEVEKKTDEVLKEAAVNEGIDEDEANALAEALAATKLVHSSGAVTEKPKEPSAAVKQEEAKEEEAKEEASEDLFTGR